MVNVALRQALVLQAVLLSARPHKTPKHSGGADRHPPGEETTDDQCAGAVGN
jgi:hypothetical protein